MAMLSFLIRTSASSSSCSRSTCLVSFVKNQVTTKPRMEQIPHNKKMTTGEVAFKSGFKKKEPKIAPNLPLAALSP